MAIKKRRLKLIPDHHPHHSHVICISLVILLALLGYVCGLITSQNNFVTGIGELHDNWGTTFNSRLKDLGMSEAERNVVIKEFQTSYFDASERTSW
jgi:uncharacterized oligopeptide transporter (OPT) family protein